MNEESTYDFHSMVAVSRRYLVDGCGSGKTMLLALALRLAFDRGGRSAYRPSSPLLAAWPSWLEEIESLRTTEAAYFGTRRVDAGYRVRVIDYWGGRCTITGLAMTECLEASHIKPWALCTDEERLDVFNGLALTPNLHKLFDLGFITIADHGTVVVSASLGEQDRKLLGIDVPMRVRGLTDAHRRYLRWQRQEFEAREKARDSEPPRGPDRC